jgi:hypothetical protein
MYFPTAQRFRFYGAWRLVISRQLFARAEPGCLRVRLALRRRMRVLVVRNELQEVAVRHRVDQHNLGRTPHAQAIAVRDFNLAYDRFGSI